jgi:hypothetical protein
MVVAVNPGAGNYPRKINKRESKVVEVATTAAAASAASAVQTLTNKSIDGDLNTVSDLPVTALKTVAGNADKVVMGTSATGVPKFDKLSEVNVATVAGNADKVLMGTSATGVPKFDKISAVNMNAGSVVLAALAAGITPAYVISVVGSGVTGSTVIGVKTGDICLKIDTVGAGAGLVTWGLAVADNTVPQTLAPGDLAIILKSAS